METKSTVGPNQTSSVPFFYRAGAHAALLAVGTVVGRFVCRLPLKQGLAWSALAIIVTELVHRGKRSWKLDLLDSALTTTLALGISCVFKRPVDVRALLAMQIIGKLASYLVQYTGGSKSTPPLNSKQTNNDRPLDVPKVNPDPKKAESNEIKIDPVPKHEVIKIVDAKKVALESFQLEILTNLPKIWNAKCLLLENSYDPMKITLPHNQGTLIFEQTYYGNDQQHIRNKNKFMSRALLEHKVVCLSDDYTHDNLNKGKQLIAVQWNGTILSKAEAQPFVNLLFPTRQEILERIHLGKVEGNQIISSDQRCWEIYQFENGYFLSQRSLNDQGYALNEVSSCWGGGCQYGQDISLTESEYKDILSLEGSNNLRQTEPRFYYESSSSLEAKNEALKKEISEAITTSTATDSLSASKELIFESIYLGNVSALNQELIHNNYIGTLFDISTYQDIEIVQPKVAFTRVVSVAPSNVRRLSCVGPRKPYDYVKKHFFLEIDETPALMANMVPKLEKAFLLIDQARVSGEPILIHCQQGKHRSAFIVAAYLVYTLRMEPAVVIEFLKKRRALVELQDQCVGDRPVEVALRWLYQATMNQNA